MISHSMMLRMRNISYKVVEKIEAHILCSVTFPQKSCRLGDNVEKYDRPGQATVNNIIRHMRFAETAVAQWLRYCVTNRKVAGSIPAGVIGMIAL